MTKTDERIKELQRLLREKKKEKKIEVLNQYKKYLGMETEEQYKRFIEVMNTKHGNLTTSEYIIGVDQKDQPKTESTTTPTEPRHAMSQPFNTDTKTVASTTSPLAKK